MYPIFADIPLLDSFAREKLLMPSEILMENAARSMAEIIRARFRASSVVQIVAGSGNNGADGIALARMLCGEYRVRLSLPLGIKSELGSLQLERAKAAGIVPSESLGYCDVLVDSLFGSGLSRDLGLDSLGIINEMNSMKCYKLACDIPSGLDSLGNPRPLAFIANSTCAMGAIPISLLNDAAKPYVGEIVVGNLGIARSIYERGVGASGFLLTEGDLRLPSRVRVDSHKGNYGHVAVVAGEQGGASVMSALSALRFGAGLVSLVGECEGAPYEIMKRDEIPSNTTTIVCGMGLGNRSVPGEVYQLPSVLDADMFARDEMIEILAHNKNLVLTPHPKEFSLLLRNLGIANLSVDEVQRDRFALAIEFSRRYTDATLLLKGANVIIAQNSMLYVNTLGSARLAKGGSGDVLAGIIGALLAQGYSPLEASIHGSLAHTLASNRAKVADYALSPIDIIDGLARL